MWIEIIYWNDVKQSIHFSVHSMGRDFARYQAKEPFVKEVNIIVMS